MITSERNLSEHSKDSAEISLEEHQLEKLGEDKYLLHQAQNNRTAVESSRPQHSGSMSQKFDQMAGHYNLKAIETTPEVAVDLEVLPRHRLPGFSDGQRASTEAVRAEIEATIALATLTLLCSSENKSCKKNIDGKVSISASLSPKMRKEFAGIMALRTILVHASWVLAPASPAVHKDNYGCTTSTSNLSAGTLPPGAGAAALEAFVLRLVQLARSPIEAVAEVCCYGTFTPYLTSF